MRLAISLLTGTTSSMRLLRLRSVCPPSSAIVKAVMLGGAATFLWAAPFLAPVNAPALTMAPPANVGAGQPTPADGAQVPGAPSDPAEENSTGEAHLDNPKDVFEKVELTSDAQGHPQPQTIRLNERVIVKEGERYSGFWFVADRSEFARKQGVNKGAEKLSFYWYFLPPRPMKHWAVGSVVGVMHGGWSFCPLKLDGSTRLRDAPPPGKNELILQQLAGPRLKEGKEYYLEFGFPLADTRPVEMAFCAGFRETIGNYNNTWDGRNKALRFLGLEHPVSHADFFH